MAWFKKDKVVFDQAAYDAELASIRLEIERARLKNELLKEKLELDLEKKRMSDLSPNPWGGFFSKLGELGNNVKSNLDAEAASERPSSPFNESSITSGIPGVYSDGKKKKR